MIIKNKKGIIFGKSNDWSPGINVRPKPNGLIKKISNSHKILFLRLVIKI